MERPAGADDRNPERQPGGVQLVAATIDLPALTHWRHQEESPEAAPGFDDSRWQVADKTTTNSITPVQSLPILNADDYGFHTGNVWYRGHFQATGNETGTGGLGQVSLTNYGSYASSLSVGPVSSPGYQAVGGAHSRR